MTVSRPRWPATVALACALLVAWPSGLGRAEAPDEWAGAFHSSYGVFFGGGVGGGLVRSRWPGESKSRFSTGLPVNLRAGVDFGRYGLALLVDAQYSLIWGPSRDQGPRPANREGTMQMLSVGGSLVFRPLGPLFFTLGGGVAMPVSSQDLFHDPASVRTELVTAVGFIYRLPRKKESETRGAHYPLGLTVSIESRYYVPWDEHFFNYSIMAVMTFYIVLSAR